MGEGIYGAEGLVAWPAEGNNAAGITAEGINTRDRGGGRVGRRAEEG